MTIQEEKELLFDDNFECREKVTAEDIIHFCDRLKEITGIQTCNASGMRYEYLPKVYQGAIELLEKQEKEEF